MAESAGDKTEAPTPRRRQEARSKGQVARSQDLSSSVVILGMIILLGQTGPGILKALREAMAFWLSERALQGPLGSDVIHAVFQTFPPIALAVAPLLVGAMLLAVIVNLMQVGFHLTPERIQPNLAALNPQKGIQKILGGGNGPVQFGMNLAKLTLVAFVAYTAVHGKLGAIVTAQRMDYVAIFAFGAELIYSIALRITVVLLILAFIDYAWQKYKHERDLKMTKQEVKDEMRNMDGDPQIKARRRQIAMQRATQRARQSVPKADVVVTNPTEFAVALQYDEDAMHAPKVVAKGQGYLALKIREIAIQNGIPIIQRPPLARALYKLCEIGQEIPEEFYNAVAEILAYVWQLSGKKRAAGV
jgi:flagellar biosynthetic protein FlhB